jgi:hypothetical protein
MKKLPLYEKVINDEGSEKEEKEQHLQIIRDLEKS